jgi:hypothetical protein
MKTTEIYLLMCVSFIAGICIALAVSALIYNIYDDIRTKREIQYMNEEIRFLKWHNSVSLRISRKNAMQKSGCRNFPEE